MSVLEALTEEEMSLATILMDLSGLDIAEFAVVDEQPKDKCICGHWMWEHAEDDKQACQADGCDCGKMRGDIDGCFRAWPYQWMWWRDDSPLSVDCCGRSVGKTASVRVRALGFIFNYGDQEMMITGPEAIHVNLITDAIETMVLNCRLATEMVVGGRGGIKHRPFMMNLKNKSRIFGRIPQRDGKGLKGCLNGNVLVTTSYGNIPIEDVEPGHLVLTHRGRWRRVLDVIDQGDDEVVRVNFRGGWIECTADHPLLVSEVTKKADGTRRPPKPPQWLGVEDMADPTYWYVAAPLEPTEGLSLPHPPPLDWDLVEFWQLVGQYLADGNIAFNGKASYRVSYSVGSRKLAEIQRCAAALGQHVQADYRGEGDRWRAILNNTELAHWLTKHFGTTSANKRVPGWVLTLPEKHRQALFDGYVVHGDGTPSKNGWVATSVNKDLLLSAKMLATSFGWSTSLHEREHSEKTKAKFKSVQPYGQLKVRTTGGFTVELDGHSYSRINSVTPIGRRRVFDLVVDEDHSFVANGIVVHNSHPTILEIDEGQDLPAPAWVEVTETLKRGIPGARWRVHGVTRGFRDKFYEISQPGSGWTVHRKVAMCRPNWTDKERREKISMYGGKDAPDYRRNVLGEHGDAASPIFTLAAIMANTSDEGSHHTLVEYHHTRVTGEMIKEILDGVHPDDHHTIDQMLASLLKLPPGHRNGDYATFWAGMDVGFTIHPSEILVFGETTPEKRNERSKLKLLTRVTMRRVRNEHQSRVMLAVLDHYRPKGFAMDRTGVGLPLFQEAQNLCAIRGDVALLDRIEGYNFSSKVIVDFDESELDGMSVYATPEEVAERCGVKRPFVEASTDAMRVLMDDHRYQFPWDTNFIDQLQCATLEVVKTKVDEYGRRRTSAGEDHALDAARLATLSFDRQRINLLLEGIMRRRGNGPVLDVVGW